MRKATNLGGIIVKKIRYVLSVILSVLLTVSVSLNGAGIVIAESNGETNETDAKPIILSVSELYDTSSYIEVEVNKEIDKKVDIKILSGETEIGSIDDLKSKGQKYTFVFKQELKKDMQIKLQAETDNKSQEIKLTVGEDKEPPILLSDMVVIGDNEEGTIFSGQLNKKGTIEFLVDEVDEKSNISRKPIEVTDLEDVKACKEPSNDEPTCIVETDSYGNFNFKIPKQLSDKKIIVIFTDIKGNKRETLVTVQDTTKPSFETISTLKNTGRVIEGTVSEEATVTATIGDTIIGTAKAQLQKLDGGSLGYAFTIVLPKAQPEGTVITLQAKDTAKPGLVSNVVNVEVLADNTFPALEKEIEITDTTTTVEGKVNKPATVQLFVKEVALNKTPVATDAYGNFKIPIKKQKVGTEIIVKMVDAAFKDSEDEPEETVTDTDKRKFNIITVTDGTPPVIEKTDPIYNSSQYIKGQLSEPGKVFIDEGGKEISIDTKPDGSFQYPETDSDEKLILTADRKLTFTAIDNAKNETVKAKVVTVKEDKTAPKLVSPKKIEISSEDTEITGFISEKGTVSLLDSKGNTINSVGTTTDEHHFNLDFVQQAAKSKLTLLLTDTVGNEKRTTITVKDGTAPTLVIETAKVSDTTRIITGTVSEPATITAYVGSKSIGKVSVKTVGEGNEYPFTLELKEYPTAGEIILQATDSAKNSSEQKITITPTGSDDYELNSDFTITNDQTRVIGKLNKPGIVQLEVNGVALHKKPVETDENGNFKITIKKQEAGTTIDLSVKKPFGNEEYKKLLNQITVIDVIPPKIKKVETIYETSRFVEGQVSKQSEITVFKSKAGGWEEVDLVVPN